jgi:hypothetical protein
MFLFAKLWRRREDQSKPSFVPPAQKPSPKTGSFVARWTMTHLPAAILCARVISKPTADPLLLLMSADNDFLTPKLRFGKKTYPFARLPRPARRRWRVSFAAAYRKIVI